MTTDLERRRGGARPIGMIAAVAALLLLAGCSSPSQPGSVPPTTASSSSASGTPTVVPLACRDLLPTGEIAAALNEPHAAVTATSAPDGSIVGARSIEGAGGLSCAWSTPASSAAAPSRLLTVSLLPDALDDWSAEMYGDAPTPARRTFAGVSAAATCGDPGCGASMVVGTTWVRIDLLAHGEEIDGSAFGDEEEDEVYADARPAIESVVRTVRQASAAELAFPDHLSGSRAAPDCTRILSTGALAEAMGVDSATYDTTFQPSAAADSIVGAAEQRIGTVVCTAKGSSSSPAALATITFDPGQAWTVADLEGDAAARVALRPTPLAGQGSGDRSLSSCVPGGTTACVVVLTSGEDAIQIENTPDPERIAAAIAAARPR